MMRMLYMLLATIFFMSVISLAFIPMIGEMIPSEANSYLAQFQTSNGNMLQNVANMIVHALTDKGNIEIMISAVALSAVAGYVAGITASFMVPLIMLVALSNFLLAPLRVILMSMGLSSSVVNMFFVFINFLLLLSIIGFSRGD